MNERSTVNVAIPAETNSSSRPPPTTATVAARNATLHSYLNRKYVISTCSSPLVALDLLPERETRVQTRATDRKHTLAFFV